MRLAYSLVYRFCLRFIFGIYICQPETGYHNSDSPLFKISKPSLQNFQSCRLTAHSFSQLLENEPTTRRSQRHLPMKTRQTNSEAKHQTTYSIKSRTCKSTPRRSSFELFRRCMVSQAISKFGAN